MGLGRRFRVWGWNCVVLLGVNYGERSWRVWIGERIERGRKLKLLVDVGEEKWRMGS